MSFRFGLVAMTYAPVPALRERWQWIEEIGFDQIFVGDISHHVALKPTHAIETALTLRLVFKLPLRQAEGFLRSVLSLMAVDLEAPDHTTLSRRSQHLEFQLACVPVKKPLHL